MQAMPSEFVLHPQLAADTVAVGDLALSSVLLTNDSRFPWLILVPRRPNLTELTDLTAEDAARLMEEIRLASGVLSRFAKPDKLNVAALGNAVPQLHVHVIARFRSDPAWPKPIWGVGTATAYPDHARLQLVERLGQLFAAA